MEHDLPNGTGNIEDYLFLKTKLSSWLFENDFTEVDNLRITVTD